MADIFGCFASSALWCRDIEEEGGIAAASGRDLANDFVSDMICRSIGAGERAVFTMNTGIFSGVLL